MGIFVRQLDGTPLAGENCGPASVASALRWSTRHSIAPSPSLVRVRLEDPVGGTHPRQLRVAWSSFEKAALREGWQLPEMRYREHGEYSRLREILESGDAAVVAVDYSVVPAGLSGDPSFKGLHSIFVSGIVERKGERVAKVYDPLCDGRRTGIPGPGPVYWPLPLLRKATGGYSDSIGRATWNAVARSTRSETNECALELSRVHEELERTQTELASVYAQLVALVDKVEDAKAILETIASIRSTLDIGDPDASATRGLERR